MNNLTTRKIVLGLLMVLVLAFSVQGIADAISTFTRGSGDLQTVLLAPQGEFTITFSANVKGPELKAGYAVRRSNSPEYVEATPYYDSTTNPVLGGGNTLYYEQYGSKFVYYTRTRNGTWHQY